jgi:membrane associated rhomboid family serine protease
MALITIVIIAATVLASLKGFKDYDFFNRFKFQPHAITKGKQYDRLLTSGFLHVDMTHLLFNMLTLFFFANVVIQFCADIFGHIPTGSVVFAIIYILAIIGGNLLALFFQRDNYHYSAVGASGGVSGILFASIVIYPDLQLYLLFALPIKGWIFAILYLGYSVYGMQKQLGNIGHEAHLGGAIVGMAAPLILLPDLFEINKYYILGMLIPLLVLLVLAFKARK